MSINKFIETEDGSPTLFSSEFNQTYHSIHGAIAESVHVFIKNGLEWYLEHNKPENIISIFENNFNCVIALTDL